MVFEARTAALRETAKWLTVTLLGTGSVVFSGLSIAGLNSSMDGWPWVLVVFLSAVPLICAGIMAGLTARLSTVPYRGIELILPDVAAALHGSVAVPNATTTPGSTALQAEIEKLAPGPVGRCGGMDAFRAEAVGVVERRNEAEAAFVGQPLPGREAECQRTRAALSTTLSEVAEVLACVEYIEVRDAWARTRAIIYGLAGSCILAVLGAGVVSKCADVPQYKDVTTPMAVLVHAPAPGKTLPMVEGCAVVEGQSATVVAGTLREPVLLLPRTTLTPAHAPVSAATPATVPTPTSTAAGPCPRPVLWTPNADEVLVEPLPAASRAVQGNPDRTATPSVSVSPTEAGVTNGPTAGATAMVGGPTGTVTVGGTATVEGNSTR